MKERILCFDATKLLAIYAVLYGHCIQYLIKGDVYDNSAFLFIYSWHMPLFMLIAGLFATSSFKLSPIDYLKKKSIQLLLPCVAWEIIIVCIRFFSNQSLSMSDIVRHDLWFLKSLFICEVLTYIAYKIDNRCLRIFALILILVLLQRSLYRLQDMYPCFLLGVLISKYKNYPPQYAKATYGLYSL